MTPYGSDMSSLFPMFFCGGEVLESRAKKENVLEHLV
jgi:hypothetical protein